VDISGNPVQALISIISPAHTQRGVLTAGDGKFLFSSLPAATYTVCGQPVPMAVSMTATPDPPLDGCFWLSSGARRVTSTTGQNVTGVKVTVQQGHLLTIQVSDPKHLLPASIGPHSGNELSIRICGADGVVRRVPILTQAAGMRAHGMVIPYNAAHTLTVNSTSLSLTNAAGAAYTSSAPSAVQFLPGTAANPVVVNVRGTL